MSTDTKPVVAKGIQTTEAALIVTTDQGVFRIPWERCSKRLARAQNVERCQAVLSPSGYGIRWPLLDEDLAVGPLIRSAGEKNTSV